MGEEEIASEFKDCPNLREIRTLCWFLIMAQTNAFANYRKSLEVVMGLDMFKKP
jgi:hypothetical protein